MPINQRRKSRRHMSSQALFVPCARAPFPDFANRIVAIFIPHSSDGDPLLRELAVICADKKIEILFVLIKDHRKIAIAAGEVKISGVAKERASRCLDDKAEVFPGSAVVS